MPVHYFVDSLGEDRNFGTSGLGGHWRGTGWGQASIPQVRTHEHLGGVHHFHFQGWRGIGLRSDESGYAFER